MRKLGIFIQSILELTIAGISFFKLLGESCINGGGPSSPAWSGISINIHYWFHEKKIWKKFFLPMINGVSMASGLTSYSLARANKKS